MNRIVVAAVLGLAGIVHTVLGGSGWVRFDNYATFSYAGAPIHMTNGPYGLAPAGFSVKLYYAFGTVTDPGATNAYAQPIGTCMATTTIYGFGWYFGGDPQVPGYISGAVTFEVVCESPGYYGHSQVLTLPSLTNDLPYLLEIPSFWVIEILPDQIVRLGSSPAISFPMPANTWQWLFEDAPIPGATNNPLVLTNAQYGDAGLYSIMTNGTPAGFGFIVQVLPSNAPSVSVNGRLAIGTILSSYPANIKISPAVTGDRIYYSLDGTTPTTNSLVYSGPFPLTNSAVIQALETSTNFSRSAVAPPVTVNVIPVYNLQTTAVGDGTISASPTGSPYSSNTVVTLTATPAPYWVFDHWTGNATGTANPVTVTMNGPRTVQAVFVRTAYPLTLSTPGGGGVQVDGQILTKVPEYLVVKSVLTWTAAEADAASRGGHLTDIQNGEENEVVFQLMQLARLQDQAWIGLTDEGHVGTWTWINGAPATYLRWRYGEPNNPDIERYVEMYGREWNNLGSNDLQGAYIMKYTQDRFAGYYCPTNSIATLTATPNVGWAFLGWQGTASSPDNPFALVMNQTNIVQGIFGTILGTSTSGGGSVVLSPPNPIPYGTAVAVSAVPNPGNYFVNWTGSVIGTNSPTAITVTSSTQSVNAVFSSLPLGTISLSLIVNGSGAVSISPQRAYYSVGDGVTLTATTNAGGSFYGWSRDVSGRVNPLALTLTSNTIVQANFSRLPVTLSIGLAEASAGVIISGMVGYTYALQYTTNLSDLNGWTTLTNLTLQQPVEVWVDTSVNPAATPKRFYRTIALP
jgi:hypothetical protein